MIKKLNADLRLLVHTLVKSDIDQIVSDSVFDNGAIGLHTIRLINQRERSLDLFYAAPNHELWKNYPQNYREEGLVMPFMSRACTVNLKIIKGNILSWIIDDAVKPFNGSEIELQRFLPYRYCKQGKIRSYGRMENKLFFKTQSMLSLNAGMHIQLSHNQLLTIAIEQGKSACWLLQEGKAQLYKDQSVFTNTALDMLDESVLFKKPDKEAVLSIINGAF